MIDHRKLRQLALEETATALQLPVDTVRAILRAWGPTFQRHLAAAEKADKAAQRRAAKADPAASDRIERRALVDRARKAARVTPRHAVKRAHLAECLHLPPVKLPVDFPQGLSGSANGEFSRRSSVYD